MFNNFSWKWFSKYFAVFVMTIGAGAAGAVIYPEIKKSLYTQESPTGLKLDIEKDPLKFVRFDDPENLFYDEKVKTTQDEVIKLRKEIDELVKQQQQNKPTVKSGDVATLNNNQSTQTNNSVDEKIKEKKQKQKKLLEMAVTGPDSLKKKLNELNTQDYFKKNIAKFVKNLPLEYQKADETKLTAEFVEDGANSLRPIYGTINFELKVPSSLRLYDLGQLNWSIPLNKGPNTDTMFATIVDFNQKQFDYTADIVTNPTYASNLINATLKEEIRQMQQSQDNTSPKLESTRSKRSINKNNQQEKLYEKIVDVDPKKNINELVSIADPTTIDDNLRFTLTLNPNHAPINYKPFTLGSNSSDKTENIDYYNGLIEVNDKIDVEYKKNVFDFDVNTNSIKGFKPGTKEEDKKSLSIPGKINGYDVLKIADNAFKNQTQLTKIENLGPNVTEIGANAFKDTTKLTSVNFKQTTQATKTESSKLTLIKESAFENSGLKKVSLPDTVSIVQKNAFKNNKSLTEITLSENMTEVAESTFHIPSQANSPTTRNGTTQQNTTRVEKLIIPANISTISKSAFEGLKIKSLQFGTKSSDTVKLGEIRENAFKDSGIENSVKADTATTRHKRSSQTNAAATSLTFPSSLSAIGVSAFKENALTKIIFQGSTFKQLGSDSFKVATKTAETDWVKVSGLPSVINNQQIKAAHLKKETTTKGDR